MPNIAQKCRISGRDFVISEEEQKFLREMGVPLPTVSPEERLRRRLCERNARTLYYRKCDFSGERIISHYHEGVPFPVYDQAVWWSDKWDGLAYGRDFDFGRGFFEQFLELKNLVPHMSVFIVGGTLENSDFTTCTGYIKNCYLVAEADYDEDCYYSNRIYQSKNLVDCSNVYESELLYECIDCIKCQRSAYLQECESCSDSWFLRACVGCRNCIGCINQRHKQYMIFNKQYSKEEYESKKLSLDEMRDGAEEVFAEGIYKNLQMERCENCTGDHLYDSKNCVECFDCKDLEDCMYCQKVAGGVKDSMDYTSWGFKSERMYQCAACGDNVYNLKFCSTCLTNMSDSEYCYGCNGCRNCFGCVGLNKKEFCILNKQYSEPEYVELRGRIVALMKERGEWGEYFPPELCSFAYNETIAMDHLPVEKAGAVSLGYSWRDEDKKEYKPAQGDVLACEVTGKNFKILDAERKFYEKMGLPIPRRCPDQRHRDRMAKRNPWKLFSRKCARTGVAMLTSFAPGLSETVVCNKAYLGEVY